MVIGQGRAQVGMWDTEQSPWSLGCAASLPEHRIPAMPLTLCWPCLEADGRRAGGSCGALQGPSSTHSAHAAGQGCCSSARCLLGRQEPGQRGSCFALAPKTWVLHLIYPRTSTPRSPRCGCLPAPRWWGWALTRGAGCLCSHRP